MDTVVGATRRRRGARTLHRHGLHRLFTHTGSDGSSVRNRVEAQGYAWSWIKKNHFVTGNTEDRAQAAFDWWMNRTPHRYNLLSPNNSEFRAEHAYESNIAYGRYFVAVFARPG